MRATRTIAGAVNVAAQVRPAAHDAFLHAGFVRIVAVFWSGWIFRRALGEIIRVIPIGAPFPDVAGPVVQAEAIWWKGRNR